MLKALLLDLDKTLCDTNKADHCAVEKMAEDINCKFGSEVNSQEIAEAYLRGIYRKWTSEQEVRYMPIIEGQGENQFRLQLIMDLLGAQPIDSTLAQDIQDNFNQQRIAAFDFYPGIVEFLAQVRESLTLIVITNGPEFSQKPKIDRVNLPKHVDHILIGGLEPEQKPSSSIFFKALELANCEAHEAIHVGDSLAADIDGANNAGITSVWIQHQQPLDAELGINPDHTLFHPSEIPDLVNQIHKTCQ